MVAEWSKSVAFKAGVSQRRFESGRRQTVTVTACTLWQGSLDLSATSPMTTSDAETDVKLNIYLFIYLFIQQIEDAYELGQLFWEPMPCRETSGMVSLPNVIKLRYGI